VNSDINSQVMHITSLIQKACLQTDVELDFELEKNKKEIKSTTIFTTNYNSNNPYTRTFLQIANSNRLIMTKKSGKLFYILK
jgi:hypothetical protein